MGPINRCSDGDCVVERYPTPINGEIWERRQQPTPDDVQDGIAEGLFSGEVGPERVHGP